MSVERHIYSCTNPNSYWIELPSEFDEKNQLWIKTKILNSNGILFERFLLSWNTMQFRCSDHNGSCFVSYQSIDFPKQWIKHEPFRLAKRRVLQITINYCRIMHRDWRHGMLYGCRWCLIKHICNARNTFEQPLPRHASNLK